MLSSKTWSANFLNLLTSIILILCVAFVYKMQKNMNKEQYISIAGTAEKEIIIDRIKWTLTIERKGDKLEELHKGLIGDKENIARFLKENGITEDEIEMTDFVSEDKKEKVSIIGANIKVKTKNIPAIFQMRTEMGTLYAAGVKVIRNDIEATYSKIEEEMHELSMIAAKDARRKAKDIAQALNIKDMRILTIEIGRQYVSNTQAVRSNQNYNSTQYTTKDDKNLLKTKINSIVHMKVAIK